MAAVISFIDCINRGDLDGLTALMADDHALLVLDEEPVIGRSANRDAWHGYFTAFPEYVVYPRQIVGSGGPVAVLGSTTGSHLGLPDAEEFELDVVWLAEVVDGHLTRWQIADDTPELRVRVGLSAAGLPSM